MDLKSLVIKNNTFEDFYRELNYHTEPVNRVTKNDIGKYVRIKAETYGDKTPIQFNMSIPKQGEIIKINTKSVNVKVNDKILKFPTDMLIYDITELQGVTPSDLKEMYLELKEVI